MEKKNRSKANLLYKTIDNSPLFYGTAAKKDRSKMNVTFLLNNPDLTDNFLEACAEAGCVGVKGHRSVGGFRASIYNALEKESIEVLTDVMRSMASQHG